MSSRLGNWTVAIGAFVLFLGLCVLGTSFGKNGDPDEVPAGAGLFSMGALALATGIYLKARALQSTSTGEKLQAATNPTRSRTVCELCANDAPVVQCKIHQLHLCGNCLSQHYDVRSCIYVPSTRAASKTGKGLSAKARGA
ncbi:MAG TPA: hypothetical protein VFA74_18145 [Terriglobales bacterium]|nr:hypothetical protein [Terriglobales bacterium]